MSEALLPELSDSARIEGRRAAMAARAERAEIKRALKTGTLRLAAVLDHRNASAAGGLRLSALIAALPGYGPRRAERSLKNLGLSGERRLRSLGRHQRRKLCEEVGAPVPRTP